MPTICYFYQGIEAQVAIQTGEIIEGNLPRQARNLVEKWRRMHVDELMDNWNDAVKLIMPKKIAPLE